MGAFFSALLAKLTAIVGWFGALFAKVFVALWDLLRDVLTWPVEQFLGLAKSALTGIDTSAMTDNLSAWGSLPAEVSNVMGLLGVGTACTIIAAAIAIRIVLQLIPFTRLGS